VGGSYDGWQVAPGFSYVSDRLVGLQFGGVNMAVRSEGTQIGLPNFTTTAMGSRWAPSIPRRAEGRSVGMVNLAKNGDADWIPTEQSRRGEPGIYTSVRRFY
jgi:hypothetical protein